MLFLLFVASALAHRPHAVILAVATRDDFETSGRAWAVMDPSANAMLLRTDDFGRHWDFQGGEPQVDALIGAAYHGPDLLVLGDTGTLWVSPDEGGTWSRLVVGDGSLEATGLAATGERIAVATFEGLYAGDLSALEAVVPDVSFEEAALSDEGVVIGRTLDGAVWRVSDAAEALPPLPEGVATSIAELAGVTYAGTDGGVYRFEAGAWSACGAIDFAPGINAPERVAQLAVGQPGGVATLLAATGEKAWYESADGCASWTLVDSGQTATYGGLGDAWEAENAFKALVSTGDARMVAGFNGASVSGDAGATWREAAIVPADYCRGLFFNPAFPTDPLVAFGSYGGGPAWTTDGGLTWEGRPADNQQAIYAQGMEVAPDFGTSGTFWWSGRPNPPAVTRDRGQTWTSVEVGYEGVRAVQYVGDELWALGDIEEPSVAGRISVSRDGGETWALLESAHAAMGAALPNSAVRGEVGGVEWTLLVTDAPTHLFGSTDGGDTWAELYAGPPDDERAAGVVIRQGRIVFGSLDGGMVLSDDGGETWRVPSSPPGEPPRVLAGTDDGTLFVAGSGGQMYRSADGGERWEAVGERIPPGVHVMDTSPRFSDTRMLLLGTEGGLFWSGDAGESWHRVPRFQRFETGSFHLSCTGVCEAWGDDHPSEVVGWSLAPGDSVSFTFRGHRFSAIGEAQDAVVDVSVNGVSIGTLDAATLTVDGLPDTWQDVVLRVESGVLKLDAIEALGEGDVMPIPLPEDTGDTGDTATADSGDTAAGETGEPVARRNGGAPSQKCGCGTSGTPTGMYVAGLLAALARRRSRRR